LGCCQRQAEQPKIINGDLDSALERKLVLDLGSVFDAAVFESGGNFVDLFQANILNELVAVSKNRRSENSAIQIYRVP
jgi:hypothetical protein